MKPTAGSPLRTLDGRYIVVRGRLWRGTRQDLPEAERERLVKVLMDARRALKSGGSTEARTAARAAVDAAKVALGERGAVWWKDGAPDFNRHMVRNTPYAAWAARVVPPAKP